MTDKEIIKALKCCTHNSKYPYCSSCPARCGSAMCIYHTMKNALDLINRQQEDIEALKKVVLEDYATEYDNKIKSEAVKEFAERLENEKCIATDFVKVTLCKDCKWFNTAGCAIRIVDDSDKPKENDFCSFSERNGG